MLILVNMKNLKNWLLVILALTGLAWFFSYRILIAPLGLTADEGGFGVNAVYLSQTLRDENGIMLPVFALSLGGKEWRQPVTQYYMAAFFKLFGPGVFTLRFSSVVITLSSAVLMYLLVRQLTNVRWSIFAVGIFLMTPLVMLQTHLGLDNLMPVPFTIAWLLGITLYHKSPKSKYLFWSGVSLGIGFYTYKGMRATVPVWVILTELYLLIKHGRGIIKASLPFIAGLAPFFAVIPFLEKRYPGAVFDNKGFNWDSWYTFLYPYLSSFDLSFLFITGDALLFHSTGKHGMMLLATLPLFLVGIYYTIRYRNFNLFFLVAFLSAPLLFGFVNSVHRASRLMSMIPAYSLLVTLGAQYIWNHKKIVLAVIGVLMVFNYADFVNYYWFKYPELTRVVFGDMSAYQDYVAFRDQAKILKLTPYIENTVADADGTSGEFYQLSYLPEDTKTINEGDVLPEGSILLSNKGQIAGLEPLPIKSAKYHILVNRNK